MEKLRCECVYSEADATLYLMLCGSIDHHTVKPVREEMDRAIYQNRAKNVVLDLNGVEFMDSSGLGLILGRYTKVNDMGCAFALRGVSDSIMRIVTLAGIDKFISVQRQRKNTVR